MKHARWAALVALFPVACSADIESPSTGTGGTGGSTTVGGDAGAGGSSAGTLSSGATGGSAAGQPSAGTAGIPAGTGGTPAGTGGGAGVTTTGGTAGTGGSAGTGSSGMSGGGAGGMTPGIDSCPMPPEDVPENAVIALNTENEIRVAMGLGCAVLVPALITSAQNHCDYYVTNQGDAMCEASSPHNEVEGCPGFTGEGLGDRMRAAGYTGRGGSECMAFTNDPVRSTMMFVNSVYHRTPVLDPWMRELGYGAGDGCDTIDYGQGEMTAQDVTAFYPYASQTEVPTSFDGSREGPEPPMPASGWPSGYPVTIYARDFTVSSHTIVVDGTTEDLPHQWLAEDDPTLPSYAKVLYTDAPLTANTTYRVTVSGTREGAALDFDWTFTTGAAGGRPGRM
jgi:hypothetical protein